jgi:hypothetical protein
MATDEFGTMSFNANNDSMLVARTYTNYGATKTQ